MIINAKERRKIEERNGEVPMTVLLDEGGFAQKLTLDPCPKEGKGGNQMGESVPVRGGSKQKGLEHGLCLGPLRDRAEASMAGGRQVRV